MKAAFVERVYHKKLYKNKGGKVKKNNILYLSALFLVDIIKFWGKIVIKWIFVVKSGILWHEWIDWRVFSDIG